MPSKVQCCKNISQINNQNMFQTCVFNQYVQGKETPLHFNLFFKLMITNIKIKNYLLYN
jgi:hypothetical protein